MMKCPVCHVRDKSTVITRCYHVFCADCVQTCIDTRQRKCPGCAKPFGADDVHQLFLF